MAKKQLYQKRLNTGGNEDQNHYARGSREVKREITEAKQKLRNEKCHDVNRYIGETKVRTA